MLEWVFRRCDGEGETVESPIGLLPAAGRAQHRRASRSPTRRCAELLSVDAELVKQQLPQVKEHLDRFGDQLPQQLRDQLASLEGRLD